MIEMEWIAPRRMVRTNSWIVVGFLLFSLGLAETTPAMARYDAPLAPPEFLFGLHPIHLRDGPFGFAVEPEPFRAMLQREAQLGAEATRIWTFWGHIERQPHVYRWNQLDRAIRRSIEFGLEPWLNIVGSPHWACAASPIEPHPANICPPAKLGPYKRWLRKLVKRYRDQVRYYEIWNEPNLSYYWPPQNDPIAYATLLKASYHSIKEVNPYAQVVIAGPSSGDFSYLDAVLDALGGRTAFDAASMHAYRITSFPNLVAPWQTREVVLPNGEIIATTLKEEIEIQEALFTDHGYGEPDLWITEIGWPAHDRSTGPAQFSLREQARFLHQTFNLVLNDPDISFVRGVFWFSDRDWAVSPEVPQAINEFGLYGLVRSNKRWKPAAYKFHHLASRRS
jgi:hypothetical protein